MPRLHFNGDVSGQCDMQKRIFKVWCKERRLLCAKCILSPYFRLGISLVDETAGQCWQHHIHKIFKFKQNINLS